MERPVKLGSYFYLFEIRRESITERFYEDLFRLNYIELSD